MRLGLELRTWGGGNQRGESVRQRGRRGAKVQVRVRVRVAVRVAVRLRMGRELRLWGWGCEVVGL